jgi:L-alanine-DL-glutamate epimerase-like enolase superfamily enzyme
VSWSDFRGSPVKSTEALIQDVKTAAFTVPTASPEADGTLSWNSTTLVIAEIRAAGNVGLGYTYGHKAIQNVAETLATRCLYKHSAFDIPELHSRLVRQVRNDGSHGVTAMAISMLDIALWDLKAKLLGCAISALLGRANESVAIYGSGGFTSYSDTQLSKQLDNWVKAGARSVKMKVGSDPVRDPARVKVARNAIGSSVQLYVDANGAYSRKQALSLADDFAEQGVTWFEEPVSSDCLDELRFVTEQAPSGMEIAAGEYGYDVRYFQNMLDARAVDILQADATRCGGFTGFMQAATIAASYGVPLSAHCAPSLHLHAACAVPGFRNVEYFFDHARIEEEFFDGFMAPIGGRLKPDLSRLGLGLVFKRQDAQRFAA